MPVMYDRQPIGEEMIGRPAVQSAFGEHRSFPIPLI